MEYKIEEKEKFKVVGLSKIMKYDSAYDEVPKLWKSFFVKNQLSNICTKLGCKLVKRNIQELAISISELSEIYIIFQNKEKDEIKEIISEANNHSLDKIFIVQKFINNS